MFGLLMTDSFIGRGVWLFICGGLVATSSFLPSAGACGTAYSLTLQYLAAALNPVRSAQHPVYGQSVVALISVGVFGLPALAWYVKAPPKIYTIGLLIWTAAYLCLYFFAFPTTDCP